jgi:hypothetical protein
LPGKADSIAAGAGHTCYELGGVVTCIGYDGEDETDPYPIGLTVRLTHGGSHTCGFAAGDVIDCWGDARYGQTSAPGGAFVAVSAGDSHGCAVDASGSPTCWGWNYYSQAQPQPPPATTYVSIDPVRLLDSRTGNGVTSRFKANVARSFQVTGRAGIPANALAITGNLTVVGQTKGATPR